MSRAFFYCFKCEKQKFCDRIIIADKRDKLMNEWENSSLFEKMINIKKFNQMEQYFDTEKSLFERCEHDMRSRSKK